MDALELKALLTRALTDALQRPDIGGSAQAINMQRASQWVSSLADQFRQWYLSDTEVKVFTRETGKRCRTEFLYDIHICKTKNAVCPSGAIAPFASQALWQVESELHDKKLPPAVDDFQKLLMGNAPMKLFVGPLKTTKGIENYKKTLLTLASDCPGTVYMSLIPHPRSWREVSNVEPTLFRYADAQWVRV